MAGGIEPDTNLQPLKRSRSKPKAGDVFAMRLLDGNHLFGRVIGAELPLERAPMPGSYLIYIYDHRSADTTPDLGALVPQRLLIPPTFINRMPWTKGYFETVMHSPLARDDLLEQHCFRHSKQTYVDERGRPRRWRVEPCGEWGLAGYRFVDDRISDAIGVPRAR